MSQGTSLIDNLLDRINENVNQLASALKASLTCSSQEAHAILEGVMQAAIDGLRMHRIAALKPPERKYVPYSDKIMPFLDTYWSDWIKLGALSMPVLSRYDMKAYNAIHSHLKRGRRFPASWDIPSKSELIRRGVSDPDVVREARRVSRAAARVRLQGAS